MTNPRLIVSEARRRIDSGRTISGECSICGDILLEQLDDKVKPDPELLRDKLQKVFQQHLAENHLYQPTE